MSTKMALEQLGFGPCHHMNEVIENPAQMAHWKAVSEGAAVDWTEVFAGYVSQVDWPGARVWEEMLPKFPEAVVIHTERPEETWWTSFSGTIARLISGRAEIDLPPDLSTHLDRMADWLFKATMNDPTDKASAIAAYRRNNARVRELVRPERLLVFEVTEGWGPICEFLEVRVPETPFPRSNAHDGFWTNFGGTLRA